MVLSNIHRAVLPTDRYPAAMTRATDTWLAPATWIVTAIACLTLLPHDMAALTLLAYAVSSGLAHQLTLFARKGAGAIPTVSHALAWALSLWLLLSSAAMLAFEHGLIPALAGQPLILLSILALALGKATLMILLEIDQKTSGWRPALLAGQGLTQAGSVVVIAGLGAADVALILAAAILAITILIFVGAARADTGLIARRVSEGQMSREAWVWADVILLLFVLHGEGLLAYLVARGIAAMIPLCLGRLEARTAVRLAQAYRRDPGAFRALAARLNLGVLLIGGAVALVTLAVVPVIDAGIWGGQRRLASIAPWLILAVAAPVVFGATDLLLGVAGAGKTLTSLRWCAVLGLICAAVIQDDLTEVGLAQTVAVSHLGFASVTALLLARRAGIWPGLTALFLHRIRLF